MDTQAFTPNATTYATHGPMSSHQILEKAAEILAERFERQGTFNNPSETKDYLSYQLAHYDREVFAIMLLDSKHQLIEFKELFFGTVDAASVYPREVVKAVLEANATSVICAHNHPSGNPEPSEADKQITHRLIEALGLLDVQILDHIVVGKSSVSFAERGLL